MHAHHRLVNGLRIVVCRLRNTGRFGSVHVPANRGFPFANHRDVVLRLASHYASAATRASIQIDGHAPGVAFIFHFGIERKRILLRVGLRKLGIFWYSSSVAAQAGSRPSVALRLRGGQRPSLANSCELRDPFRSTAFPEDESAIEPGARANAPSLSASVTQKRRHAIIRRAPASPTREQRSFVPLVFQFDGVFVFDSQALGSFGAEHGHRNPM